MDIREGDIVFAVYSYVAETPEAINLVEGERLYILGVYLTTIYLCHFCFYCLNLNPIKLQ